MSSEEPKTVEAKVFGSITMSAYGKARVILGPESYRRLASEHGFQVENLEKVIRLGEVLHSIRRSSDLGTKIALKGGTAINLMSDPIRRLSVDLDFNYIGSVGREEMLAERPKAVSALREVAADLGYAFRIFSDPPAFTGIVLPYRNSSGSQDQLKLDLNWMNRVPLGAPQIRQLWQPSGVERPEALLVSAEELAVGKLRALIDRSAARDVFDACHLPLMFGGDWPSAALKALFTFYSGTLNLPLSRYLPERIDRLSEVEYQNHLLPVLSGTEIPSRIDLIEQAKAVISPFLDLSSSELDFVNRLQLGDLRPEILFPGDLEFAAQLSRHPALLWKADNARKHANRRSS